MIYTISEYCKLFTFNNRRVSGMTIKRRCSKNQLPHNHIPFKLPNNNGLWIIDVKEEEPEKPSNKFEIA
jgi:hypothetical protein